MTDEDKDINRDYKPKIHNLKTDQEAFSAVLCGEKTYEIRYNDRNYQAGDILVLKETKFTGVEMKQGSPLEFTGRQCGGVITHVLNGPVYGLQEGWAILSLYLSDVLEFKDFTEAEKRRFHKNIRRIEVGIWNGR